MTDEYTILRHRTRGRKRSWLAWLLLAVAAAVALTCSNPTNPSVLPNVAGKWFFTGEVSYGGVAVCADTLTMQVAQQGEVVTAETTDWRFWCEGTPSEGTPGLSAVGVIKNSQITLRWTTDTAHTVCPACWAFTTFGRVDSVMRGTYYDFLGGAGVWIARPLPF